MRSGLARGPALGIVLGLAAGLAMVSGCAPQPIAGFDSPAPSKRIDAIVDASGLEDDQSLLKLVEKLRSPDPVERMFAIRSLEIRTGETLGYDHAGHDWQRLEGFHRWVELLEEQGIDTISLVTTTRDAGEPADDEPMGQQGHEPTNG